MGIEIGQDNLRIIKVRESGMVLELEKIASVPLPTGPVGAQIAEGTEAIQALLRDLLRTQEISLRGMHVCVSIPDQLGILRLFKLPPLGDKQEIYKGIEYTISKELAFELGDIVADYYHNEATEEILILAIRKNLIDGVKKVVASLGGKVRQIEFPFISISRFLGEQAKGKSQVLLTLSNGSTGMALIREGLPYHVSALPKGFQDLMECIPSVPVGTGTEMKMASGKLEPLINQICVEILRALKSYELRQLPPLPFEILLIGKWKVFPLLDVIVSALQERFSFPVTVARYPAHLPLVKLSQEIIAQVSDYATLLGLGLAPYGKEHAFNLLAPQTQKQSTGGNGGKLREMASSLASRLRAGKPARVGFVLTAGMALFGSLAWFAWHGARLPRGNISRVPPVKTANLITSHAMPHPFQAAEAAVKSRPGTFLEQVEEVITLGQGIELEDLLWDRKGTMKIVGRSLTETGVFIYLNNLNGSRLFKQAVLDNMTADKEGTHTFAFQVVFNSPEAVPTINPATPDHERHFSLVLGEMGAAVAEEGNHIESIKKGEGASTVAVKLRGSAAGISEFLTWLSRSEKKIAPLILELKGLEGSLSVELQAAVLDEIPQPGGAAPSKGKKKVDVIPGESFGLKPKTPEEPAGKSRPEKKKGPILANAWALKGIVQNGDEVFSALVERNGKGYFVKAGEKIEEAEVMKITADRILLRIGGQLVELKMKEETRPK